MKRYFWAIVALAWITACNTSTEFPLAEAGHHAPHTIIVTSNGWHTGIIIAANSVNKDQVPEISDLSGARYFEFGWGDRKYYPADRPTLGLAFMALFAPTPSVVHVAGRDQLPVRSDSELDVLNVSITTDGRDRLISFIAATFDRAGNERARSMGPGLYPHSHFYAAHGKFHIFNTCNTWTARALVAAGLPVSTSITQADDLMRQLYDIVKSEDAEK
jgi:uncharacterized protein (TIGR02117 family)